MPAARTWAASWSSEVYKVWPDPARWRTGGWRAADRRRRRGRGCRRPRRPGGGRATTSVVSRWAAPSRSSTAVAVSSFMFEAGMSESSGRSAYRVYPPWLTTRQLARAAPTEARLGEQSREFGRQALAGHGLGDPSGDAPHGQDRGGGHARGGWRAGWWRVSGAGHGVAGWPRRRRAGQPARLATSHGGRHWSDVAAGRQPDDQRQADPRPHRRCRGSISTIWSVGLAWEGARDSARCAGRTCSSVRSPFS